jgi:fatty-acyl-CoA synthase
MLSWAEATVMDVFDSAVDAQPEGEAIVCGDERWTYRALSAEVDRLALGLRQLGVRKGDRVALWMVNRTEWLVTYFATARLGAVLVALNSRYTAEECRHILEVSSASVLVVQDTYRRHDYVGLLRGLCPEIDGDAPGSWSSTTLPDLREVVVLGPGGARGTRDYRAVVDVGARALEDGVLAAREDVAVDDLFLLLFTSGTTSKSKGVMLTHRNIVANNFNSGERQRLTSADRMLFVLPLASAFSCAHGLIAILSHHGTSVLLDAFSPSECMRLIEVERCTTMYGVGSMFHDLIDAPDRHAFDLASLRTGVGILTPEQAEAIRVELGVPEYHNGWGMTESGGVSTMTSPSDPIAIRTGTIGTPLPGVELKLVDPVTGDQVESGTPGEILVRGASVSAGYYGDQRATDQTFDSAGWLHTADLAQLLPGGYVKYLGRLKDVIKTNGFSVSPQEVEAVITNVPGVRSAAVVGVPDPRLMEAVYAFVVRESGPGDTLDAEGVLRACAEQLAGYKVPRHVTFVEGDLPRNDLGKVLKKDLRGMAQSHLSSPGPQERPQ